MKNKTPQPAESGDPDHHFVPPTIPSLANTDYRHARWPGDSPKSQVSSPEPVKEKPDILVVGVCSAGKSTLVRTLKEKGINARACSQEHSYVPHLWQLSNPGALIYLDASLHTIRRRRKAHWQQNMLDEEHRRLAHARQHCDLYVDTDGLAPEDVASRVVGFLRKRTINDGQ